MKFLYIHNFKGFNNTYIPIKQLNFLVGENSTGKTVVLSVLNLLASVRFWALQAFNTPEISLGSFKDMVSIQAEKNTYFRIGGGELDRKTGYAFLMTFVEEDGFPIIAQYKLINAEQAVDVLFSQKLIRYKIQPLHLSGEFAPTLLKTFKTWTTKYAPDRKGFKQIKLDSLPFQRKGALAYINNLIQSFGEDHKTFPHIKAGMPQFIYQFSWLGPMRSNPKRTYDGYKVTFSSQGDHTPYLIKKILSNQTQAMQFLTFIHRYGRESGLFEAVTIKKQDRKAIAPFELRIVINGQSLPISEVGYGISQVLPMLVELFARSKGCWFAIQQPESNLHPRAQAALGNLFFQLATQEEKRLFVETYSRYSIDQFRLNYKTASNTINLDAHVLFFERTEAGSKVHSVEIKKDGQYAANQPKAFKKFFSALQR